MIAASSLVGNDTDADNDGLSVTGVSGATHGSVDLSGGNITFTPASNYNGAASFSYTVSDGSASDSGDVSVTVTPVNDSPNATSQNVEVVKGSSNNPIELSGTDVETSAANLTYTVGDGPEHGSLSGTGRNLTYTPDAGYKGPDSFTFRVTDQGDGTSAALTSAPATVTIDVTAAATQTAVADKSATYGDSSVNLTATVTLGGDPLPVDSGKVTFTVKDGSTVIGSPVDDTTVEDGAAGVTYTLPAGTDVDDYTIHAAYDGTTLDNSAGSGTLTVTKAQLAVNAEPDSKEYGEADPTFGWNLSGFKNSENATSAGVTGEADCSRETGQAVDSYTITCDPGTLDADNYSFATGDTAEFDITKAQLAVNAEPDSKEYGEADPTFGWNLSGFKNSENATSAGVTGEADCSRETGQAVDSYTITCDPGTLDADNYSFATGDTAEFDITKAQLAVNAEPDSKEYGEADPTFGWNLSGFKNSETATSAGVTGMPLCTRAAGTDVGSYTIVCAPALSLQTTTRS